MDRPVFVIGDVHGHIDRLQALLGKAGSEMDWHGNTMLEDGTGVEVVQLGDLGHFGEDTQERDRKCYELAYELGFTVLWGNHDMAVLNESWHGFRGYAVPPIEMQGLMAKVGPKFAAARHGFLLTHAGLHPKFLYRGMDAEQQANLLNSNPAALAINAIGRARGGVSSEGGILWRDDREPLALMNQIYGHTKGVNVRRSTVPIPIVDVDGTGATSTADRWCIDVGDQHNGSLVGIWLPTLKLVAVGPDAELHEQAPSGSE